MLFKLRKARHTRGVRSIKQFSVQLRGEGNMRYNYCPVCGQKLHKKEAGDDGNVPFCLDCNKYWFAQREQLMHGFLAKKIKK